MLRMFIPASLILACTTLHAENDASSSSTRIVFEVPSENGKPASLTKEEKARIEFRLKHCLTEMTITAKSVSWTKGNDLNVVLPAMGEMVRHSVAKKLTQKPFLEMGQLRLHHVHPENRKLIAEGRDSQIIPGYELKTLETIDADDEPITEKILINKRIILDSSLIEHAQDLYGTHASKILVKLNQKGAKKIFAATSKIRHGVDRIAIILDGKVLSAPTVQASLGAHFEISGMADAAEAKKIATALLAPLSKSLTLKSINPPLAK